MSNEFPKAQKFSFVNEVDYSVGGIVSKNVIKRKVGNISLFAFDKALAPTLLLSMPPFRYWRVRLTLLLLTSPTT